MGDIYYDNDSGYAYRFVYEDIVDDDPDAGVTYYWKIISDSAVVAALEAASQAQTTADGKMTYFTASTLAQVTALSDGTEPDAQEGDILIPSADITDEQAEPTTLYFKDTVYTYTLISTEPDVFEWLPEEKKAGTVGGWTITSTQIKSNDETIILDNTNSTISIGEGTGIVILDGAAENSEPVVDHAKFKLNADGSAAFSGDLSAASGTFGTVAANKGNVLLGGTDPFIVRNNTTEILKLTNAGVLTVSGFTASSSAFYTGTKSTFASNDAGVYIASDGIALGANSPFKVTSAGALTATNATIEGAITATSGSFTGSISSTSGDIGG